MSLSSNLATAMPADGLVAANPDGNIVEVRGISKIYDGGIQALKSVDLGFPEGQMTTLLGPSGCGKTTLLKIIAGLLEPTEGEVLIKGKPVHGPGPERAFVFQDFALMPWATVLRNVAFGLELQGISREEREDTARRYIKKVGLAGFEGRYPHELSGGMRQRVGLARALSVDADVLLMDEPFSAVDEQTRRLFQEELLYLLAKENKSVIFVTHSIEEAVYVSDRIVLLSPRPGRVNKIVDADLEREGKTADEIRREKRFLDTVEEIWQTLKQYLTEERMER
jgi:NitT/TauT family transport system ATP-binding protein